MPEHLAEISTFIKVNWLKFTESKTEAIVSGNGKFLAELATAFLTMGSTALSNSYYLYGFPEACWVFLVSGRSARGTYLAIWSQ